MAEPLWMRLARGCVGVQEIPGPKHNSRIQGWLAKLGAWWSDDETPWCGVFCAAMMQGAGVSFPKEYYRARSWATWGAHLGRDVLAPGAVLVFERAGGGHVGFYVGEDRRYYHVLGGNQANAVNIMKLAKTRLIASRWPRHEPVTGRPVILTGGQISKDER